MKWLTEDRIRMFTVYTMLAKLASCGLYAVINNHSVESELIFISAILWAILLMVADVYFKIIKRLR